MNSTLPDPAMPPSDPGTTRIKKAMSLLSRDAENLQSRILTGLVKKGLLELRFPDVPNRLDQAYRTVSNLLSKT